MNGSPVFDLECMIYHRISQILKMSKHGKLAEFMSMCSTEKHSRWMGIREKGALETQEKISQQLYWINLIA